MDMEELSKSQIILLTLLVSFVTSIATGIVTVSLMDQAPPAVAQTVNRIIEHTIETVASTTPKGQAASTVVTQEKTVVVKESDLISQALQRANPSVVRLYTTSTDSATFLGLGVILDASGTIATDTDALGENAEAMVEMPDGKHVRTFVTSRDSVSGIAFLVSATTTVDGAAPAWAAVGISAQHPVLGDTVVMLAGKTVARIADGIITSLVPSGGKSSPQVIDTNINPDSIMDGSPLIDTDGTLLGLSTSVARAASPSGFISASALIPAPVVSVKAP